jgi:hypothetical protein
MDIIYFNCRKTNLSTLLQRLGRAWIYRGLTHFHLLCNKPYTPCNAYLRTNTLPGKGNLINICNGSIPLVELDVTPQREDVFNRL